MYIELPFLFILRDFSSKGRFLGTSVLVWTFVSSLNDSWSLLPAVTHQPLYGVTGLQRNRTNRVQHSKREFSSLAHMSRIWKVPQRPSAGWRARGTGKLLSTRNQKPQKKRDRWGSLSLRLKAWKLPGQLLLQVHVDLSCWKFLSCNPYFKLDAAECISPKYLTTSI